MTTKKGIQGLVMKTFQEGGKQAPAILRRKTAFTAVWRDTECRWRCPTTRKRFSFWACIRRSGIWRWSGTEFYVADTRNAVVALLITTAGA